MRGFSCKKGILSSGERVKSLLGHAAVSLAGHDAGKIYFVVGVTNPLEKDEMLLLSDGYARPFSAPKAKRTKHVRILKARDAAVADSLSANGRVDDSVIVHALKEVRKDPT